MKTALIITLLLSGCAGSNLRRATRTSTAAAALTLACDYGQTLQAARGGWSDGRFEENPIMGPTPSTERVTAYFVGTALIYAAVNFVAPDWIRLPLGMGVVGVEANTIAGNLRNTSPCGL